MRNFITKNEGFKCEKCGHENPPSERTCRNHCTKCLHSKHVDEEIPGDRKASCKGLMIPIEVEYEGKRGYLIVHKCEKCGKTIRNKTAKDDDFDVIIKLSSKKQV